MTYFAPKPETPLPNPDSRLDPGRAREQMRHSPQMVILRAMERLDEALAEKRDPWPAWYAFTKTLDAWAVDDPHFLIDVEAAKKRRAATARAQHNMEYAWQAASICATPYVQLMRRMGFFKDINAGPSDLLAQRASPSAQAINLPRGENVSSDANGTR